MSIKKRYRRGVRKKILIHFFLFAVTLGGIFYLYFLLNSSGTNVLSPLGKSNVDRGKVEKFLKESSIAYSSVVVLSDSSYLVSIAQNGQVRLSPGKDIEKQVSSLQRILRELTIEGKPFKYIDFRFNDPIISF